MYRIGWSTEKGGVKEAKLLQTRDLEGICDTELVSHEAPRTLHSREGNELGKARDGERFEKVEVRRRREKRMRSGQRARKTGG